jgi:chromosome segregation ATPase
MEKIQQILLDLSGEAAFSGEAMKQFLELKGEVDSQESTINFLRSEREKDKDKVGDLNSNVRSLEGHIEALETERESFRKRESELLDREGQMTRIEVELACERQRVEDHQSMVGLIFRNTELRKKSFGEEQHYQPGCIEIKDEYGNIKQYAEAAGHVAVPVKKEEIESKE